MSHVTSSGPVPISMHTVIQKSDELLNLGKEFLNQKDFRSAITYVESAERGYAMFNEKTKVDECAAMKRQIVKLFRIASPAHPTVWVKDEHKELLQPVVLLRRPLADAALCHSLTSKAFNGKP